MQRAREEQFSYVLVIGSMDSIKSEYNQARTQIELFASNEAMYMKIRIIGTGFSFIVLFALIHSYLVSI